MKVGLGFFKSEKDEREDLLKHRRNVLFSRFTLTATVVVFFHFLLDLSDKLWQASVIDFIICCVLGVSYFLNRFGFHSFGKILLIFFGNVVLLIYCSLVPKANGVFLFYFPVVAISSISFHPQQAKIRYALIFLSIFCTALLVLTDFRLLNNLSIPSQDAGDSFLVNVISSLLLLILCVDFMSRTNAETEMNLKKLASEIQSKNEFLEKTNVELDKFLYSTSHDLRAPISSIRGLIMIAQRECEDVAIKKYLGMMHDRTIKLDSFIHDIMNYSRNARTELLPEPANVKDIVDEIIEGLQYFEGGEQIQITSHLMEEHWISIDKLRLKVVLNNLISNAVKYHDASKAHQWVNIQAKYGFNQVIITITDNGIGIDEQYQQKVFDMFFRATDKSNGSGLGLYIVKEVVKRMGGKIRLHSVPKQGTEFVVYLPMEHANRPTQAENENLELAS